MKTKKKGVVKTQKVTLTPVQASNWLKKNTSNRPVSLGLVDDYTKQIKQGKWTLTTDSMGFDYNGNMINGQHRCLAVIKANKDIDVLVTYGMDPDSFNVIDTGKRRSSGDILGIHGYKTPTQMAAIIKMVMLYQLGVIGNSRYSVRRDAGINNQDVLNFANKNKDELEDVMDIAHRSAKEFKGLAARQVGGLYWIFRQIDRSHAVLFFHYLSTGAALKQDDPIYVLRQKLINEMGSKKKFPERDKFAWTIIAWNHSRKGNKPQKIQWAGDAKSPFPKPV